MGSTPVGTSLMEALLTTGEALEKYQLVAQKVFLTHTSFVAKALHCCC